MDPIILALDVGTSGVKASFINESLEVLAETTVTYPTLYPQSHYAEQDPQEWWQAAVNAVRAISAKAPDAQAEVTAIGLSGHMLCLLPVDQSGTPLTNALIHSDGRALEEKEAIAAQVGETEIYALTGNVLSASSPLCKALWLKNHAPEIYKDTATFLQSKDYMVLRLTGGTRSTDYSDASHGMLLNLGKMDYAHELLNDLGLSADKFPELHNSHDVVGHLSDTAAAELGLTAGIPVTAGGGDGACANTGAGLVEAGDIYCSLGTTAWIAFNAEQQFFDPQHRVFNIMSLDGHTFGVFGTMESAGRAIDWAKALFAVDDFRSFDLLAEEIAPGTEGLIFLPYLSGERSPIFDDLARGVYFGMRIDHDRRHFIRAAMEGVAMALESILSVSQDFCQQQRLKIIGGGAKSRVWLEIIADICMRDMARLSVPAAAVTSLGAAIAAGVGTGLFSSYVSASEKIKVKHVTEYSPLRAELYLQGKRKYAALYPALKDIYRLR